MEVWHVVVGVACSVIIIFGVLTVLASMDMAKRQEVIMLDEEQIASVEYPKWTENVSPSECSKETMTEDEIHRVFKDVISQISAYELAAVHWANSSMLKNASDLRNDIATVVKICRC